MWNNVIFSALSIIYWKHDTFSAVHLCSETKTEWYIVLVFFSCEVILFCIVIYAVWIWCLRDLQRNLKCTIFCCTFFLKFGPCSSHFGVTLFHIQNKSKQMQFVAPTILYCTTFMSFIQTFSTFITFFYCQCLY